MLKKLSFKGGVHPNDNKKQTSAKKIETLAPPKELVFPLTQHIGVPCTPCVQKGDYVRVGQKIADSDAFISSPIHSSVSGTVKEFKMYPLSNGTMCESIVIENDFQDTVDESVQPIDYKSVAPEDIPGIVREAGIVGMGGAAFPTHVKLMPPEDKKIDTIIINCSECEPYLTSDYRVMMENPEEIVQGLLIVLYRFGIENGHIAIEDNKPEAIKKMKEACKNTPICVDTLKTKYPQGGEKQLIYAVTKRKVPIGKLPADVGVIVINTETCAAIGRKFMYGIPLARRIITVVGTPYEKEVNYRVRIGTLVEHILSANGGFITPPKKFIIGGPMMGVAQFRTDVPVIKATSAMLALTEEEAYIPEESACIRCGRCVAQCPMGLMPLYIYDFAKRGDIDSCEKYSADACIECGCCSFGCPAKKGLVQAIRVAKQDILKAKRERAQKERNEQSGK